ncbi:MAG: hypothetical protein LAO79_30310, partial [Acidobacteriia bacterium]|nr:hypothetical protein [Terriglobia bacterium]
TDIYCLGVILYELLTGRRPFRGSPTELVRLVLETEPRRPSTLLRNPDPDTQLPCDSTQAPKWAGRLRGDLDNIVLKAMHPDPQRRYHSVGELSSDIDRYFAGLPVTAAGDDLAYRAKKFATRHRTGVVAAAVVVVSLSAGLIVAQHEASVARKQKAMSEQRAAEIRRLANSLIFDLHDAIQSLPGATPIRVTLMDRATQALDSLTNTAVDDPAIQLELAAAYRRLAEVQGEPARANLGNLRASLASYRKAQSLLEGVRRRQPKDLDVARQLASADWAIGSILLNQGDKPAAREVREKALELREWASHAPPQDLDSCRDEATARQYRR